jgi:hypothetical protein
MKVKTTQIPEDNGKPLFSRSKKEGSTTTPWRCIDPDDVATDNDDEENEVGKFFDNIIGGDGENGGKKVYWKTMFNFSEIGLTLSVNHIHSIEKTFEYHVSEYTDKEQVRYGIAINRGIPPTPSCPKTDIDVWYNREETRDQRYTEIVSALEKANVKIIEIK